MAGGDAVGAAPWAANTVPTLTWQVASAPCATPCRGTYAGGVSQQLLHRSPPALPVGGSRPNPGAGALVSPLRSPDDHLQPVRSRSDILRRSMFELSAARAATRCRATLSVEPSGSSVACRARASVSRAVEERDASRFTNSTGT